MKKTITLMVVLLISSQFYSQGLSFQWAKGIGSMYPDFGTSITNDVYGNVYTVGKFMDTADFDPGSGVYNQVSSGGYDVFISKLDPSGNFLWAKKIGGVSEDGANNVTLDAAGNIYVAGYFTDTVDFNLGSGVQVLTSSGIDGNSFILKLDALGNFVWAKSFFGGNNYCNALSVDALGNLYTIGHFVGTTDFDPGINATISTSSTLTSYDTYISKLDAAGNFIWASAIETSSFDGGADITVDKNNNVYATGVFEGYGKDFDPGSGNFILNSLGYTDMFVLKLDAFGGFVWANSIGGSEVELVNSIAIDSAGYVYNSGSFSGIVNFNPDGFPFALSSTPISGFIYKTDANGNFHWAKKLAETAGVISCNSISIDVIGNIYTAGAFSGTVNFDPGVSNYSLTSFGSEDAFIVKLDSAGGFLWAKNMGGNGTDAIYSINVLASGDIYTTGFFNTSADFDPGAGTFLLDSVGLVDVFISKLSDCLITLNAPVNITTADNLNICNGSSSTLKVVSLGSINWYATSSSTLSIGVGPIFVTPTLSTGTYTYYVDATNCVLTSTRTAITIMVNNTCADVWPGDANSDGIADNLDVLELGLHYSQIGAPRNSTSNSWQSYVATNWVGTISNGQNLNHSDCNGDGVIDANDTLAIYLNYGLTHAFKPSQQTSTNEQLTIVPDQLMVSKGQWGTASVYLGSSSNLISTINGLAFTLHFDQSLIEPNTLQIDYPISFLNTGQNLNFRKQDDANGALYAATTHTNNSNINGYGKIAVIHYQIKSSLVHDTVLAFNLVQATQSSANGSLMPLTSGSASVTAIGASVGINELSDNNMVAIYPNPAKSTITITTTSELQKIELVSVTGQVIISEATSGSQHQLDINSVSNGVYVVTVYSKNNSLQRKKIVVQH